MTWSSEAQRYQLWKLQAFEKSHFQPKFQGNATLYNPEFLKSHLEIDFRVQIQWITVDLLYLIFDFDRY